MLNDGFSSVVVYQICHAGKISDITCFVCLQANCACTHAEMLSPKCQLFKDMQMSHFQRAVLVLVLNNLSTDRCREIRLCVLYLRSAWTLLYAPLCSKHRVEPLY